MSNTNKRRSVQLMEEMETSRNENDSASVRTKRVEWEKIITDEIAALGEDHKTLEQKINEIIATTDFTSPTLKVKSTEVDNQKFQDQIDALTNKIESLKQDQTNDKKIQSQRIEQLENRLKSVETEKNELKINNDLLAKKYEQLLEQINNSTEISELKSFCLNQIDDVAKEHEFEIDSIKKKMQEIDNKNSPSQCVDTGKKLKLNIPKFKGYENERPVKFLNELERYLNVIKPNADELRCIISQALESSAQEWWYVHESEIENYVQFVEKFKERYWNTNIQRTAKRKVEFGQYYENGKSTRINYATYLFGLAKELDLNYTENELTIKISEQFERNVRYAFKAQPAKDKDSLFKILADFDDDDLKQKHKDAFKQNSNYNQHNKQDQNRNSFTKNENLHNTNTDKSNQNINKKQYSNTQNKTWETQNINAINTNKMQTKPNQQNKKWTPRSNTNVTNKQATRSHDQIDICDIIKEKHPPSTSGNV